MTTSVFAIGGTGGAATGTSGTGGAGGTAGGSAVATQTVATGARPYSGLYLYGGTGGAGTGATQSGGAGGAISSTSITASGFSARTKVKDTGGAGGRGNSGASGGVGASVSMTNVGTTTAKAGGYDAQRQFAIAGAGGYSVGGTAGAAGSATSTLAFSDSVAASVYGNATATGGAGGGGSGTTAGASGGQATTTLSTTGARTVGVVSGRATGGAGGATQGSGAGGAGGGASSTTTGISTTNANYSVTVRDYAIGGAGGRAYGTGAGGQGGAVTSANATATEASATTGGRAYAAVNVQGGAGGRSGGTGIAGGAGGSASGTTANASGRWVNVYAYQKGGYGGRGYGTGGAGGAGAASTLTNAVNGRTTGGYETFRHTAVGGTGGYGTGAVGGAGGAANSSLTFNDNTANPVHAYNMYTTVTARGGAGGSASGAAGGAGASGTATANITGAYVSNVHATATGGNGGTGSTSGVGGNAQATAQGTTTSLASSNVVNAAAAVTASATGGTGSTQGTAQATATATTANGQQASANSTTVGSTDTGQSTANALFAGVVTEATAGTNTSGAGTQTGQSDANIGGSFPSLQGGSFSAYSFVDGLPNASQVNTIITANSAIAAQLGSGNANAVILGYGTEGSFGLASASGTQTLTSTETYTLDAAKLTGHLILGLAAPQSGSGFTSLTLTTKVGGVTIPAGTQTFTSLAVAQAFFTNDAIDLGTFSATNGLTVQITETLVTSTSGNGFGDEIVLGATGGNGPPVFAGPASKIIGQNVPTAITGVSLSESGTQVGESYTVTVADTNGLLSLNGSGADVVTGSSSTKVTITGALADIVNTLATLKDTDATAGADTIVLNATSVLGGMGTPFDIAMTVNGPPVIAAPVSVGTSAGNATTISGVSISETGNTIGESFTVTLKDTNGLLTMSNPLGAGIGGNGSKTVTVSGGIVAVNAALATLSDTDTVSPSDVIAISATDSLSNTATPQSIAVSVTSAPVITAPTAATVGVNEASPISGLSLAEAGSSAGATFIMTLTDTNGLLSAPTSGTDSVGGVGTTTLTINGTLTDINASLLTLTDTDASTSTDTITVNATDQSLAAATPASITVTVASPPVLSAPASAILGQNHATRISVSLAETNASATETFTVTLTDTNGLISVGTNFGGTVTNNTSTSVTLKGTLSQVSNDLANELAILESTTAGDTLTLNATDQFGNVSSQKTVTLSVNGAPVITAPINATAGVSKPTAITGVSVAETGNTTGEGFQMTLADTNGLLSVTANPGSAFIAGSGTHTLVITGTLSQVNQAVANLSVNDATLGADTITVDTVDGLPNTSNAGNAAAQKSIAVNVVNGPVLAVPGAQLIGIGKAATISGISVSETNALATDPFTVTLADGNGNLTFTASGAAVVTGGGTNSVSISGALSDVNATLATLSDTDGTSGADTITVNASDQFAFTAGTKTVAVTVTALPFFSAPSSLIVGVGTARPFSLSVGETFAPGTETVSITLADTNGLLSIGTAFGATIGGNASKTLTLSGTFTQVDNALTTLSDTDSVIAADTITLNATDQFGNKAAAGSIAVTVNGLPVIAVPGSQTAGVSKPLAISGVSLSEAGNTAGETFSVTLADANGLLSVGNGSGATVTGLGTASLTVSGLLSQVNTALTSLSDTDSVVAPDTITLTANDGLGNAAASKTTG